MEHNVDCNDKAKHTIIDEDFLLRNRADTCPESPSTNSSEQISNDTNKAQNIEKSNKVRNLGSALMITSLLAVALSFPFIGLGESSIGSGFWCAVFIFVFGLIMRSSSDLKKPFRTVISFASVSVFFGLLMLTAEGFEIYIALGEHPNQIKAVVVGLHVALSIVAMVSVILSLLVAVVYYRSSASGKKVSCDMNDELRQKLRSCDVTTEA